MKKRIQKNIGGKTTTEGSKADFNHLPEINKIEEKKCYEKEIQTNGRTTNLVLGFRSPVTTKQSNIKVNEAEEITTRKIQVF